MARGPASPAPNALPKVSFVKLTDEPTQQPPGVHDHVARSYGYNDFTEFVRPEEHYIRYIEPLESDLATQVEYDMDEQDQEWLDAVNQERKAQHWDKVSYETFEIIMDRLEKEWFDLSKNIPKSDMALPSEDSTCAICDDSEGENTNAIVFCDGCNLAVHQDCYGVPYIPEGQWLCRKCTVSPENPVSCILCPNEGGAFKQTVSGDWVHLLCAIWVPETAVANDVFMEPITGVEKISKQRWRLRCSVCEIREGACIQCSKASCFTAFHATCARKEKLLMPMKATQGSEAPTLACYCEKHLPREQQEIRAAALRAQHTDGSDAENGQQNSKSNKTARAYAKTYKPGPPLVPRIIVNRILQYISRISIRHKAEFVQLVCRYWSLKREARRGAPLLKRLHLEPWTALSGSKQQTDEEKIMKLDHMRRLRLDLERVRLIIDVIRHREATKQRQQEQIQLVLSRFFFPHEPALRFAFEKIISHDRQGYFKSPVSKHEVPDYYDIIKNPMCWDTIDRKLDSHEYLDLAEFKNDVELVVTNAMTYNEVNTPFYRTAARIQNSIQSIFSDLDRTLGVRPPDPAPKAEQPSQHDVEETQPKDEQTDIMHTESDQVEETHGSCERVAPCEPDCPPAHVRRPTGDLEPPLGLLEYLVSEELIRQDTNVIMSSTPIESLLSYEMPNIRPPAPPPPPLKPKTKAKGKKGSKLSRKEVLERKRQERLRALDASPGFRAPRTRAAIAAAAAFEAEATAGSQPPETQVAESSSAAAAREEASGSTKNKKPRRSAAPPLADIPLTVDDVDNRQSFKMFERGWILPADQKRGGRAPIERQPLPPPKKKTKTTHEKHGQSASGSAPAERGSSSAPVEGGSSRPAQRGSSRAAERGTSRATEREPSRPAKRRPSRSMDNEVPQDAVNEAANALQLLASAAQAQALGLAAPDTTTQAAAADGTTRISVAAGDTPVREVSAPPTLLPEATVPPDQVQEVPELISVVDPEPEPESLSESVPAERPLSPVPTEPALSPVPTEPAQSPVPTERTTSPIAEPKPAVRPPPSPEMLEPNPPKPQAYERQATEPVFPRPPANTAPSAPAEVPMDVDEPPNAEAPMEETAAADPEKTSERAESPPSGQLHGGPPAEAQPPMEDIRVAGQPQAGSRGQESSEERQPEEQPGEPEEEKEDTGPPRIIYIDTLDTPATRREKNRRKKLERQAAREAAERAAASGSAPRTQHEQQPVAGPSRLPEEQDPLGGSDSDLTDLSDAEGTQQEGEDIPSAAPPGVLQRPEDGPAVFRHPRRKPPPDPAEVEPGAITLQKGEKLEGGTLVWAKFESFPWWPAVVFEEDDPEVPPSVLARAPPREPDLELVRFYEKKHINNWAWVRHRNMRYLGEDDALDALMLAPASKYQRWRSAARRTECRNAYRDALAEMEADVEAQEPQPQPQLQSQPARQPARSRGRGSGAANRRGRKPKKTKSVSEAEEAGTGGGSVPAAMEADSPMTDADSFE